MRTYLEPTAPIAPDALVVDDPKVAMDLAISVCEAPRMSNLAHGLWGYSGTTEAGAELTVQSLGIGGPSAAAVMTDLARLGVERAIRIGSCIALEASLQPGSSLIATGFAPADGTTIALTGGAPAVPDHNLTEALAEATGAEARGVVRSVDVVAEATDVGDGAVALDQSSAAFAAAGARGGIACAEALVVARSADSPGLERDALDEALIRLGARAAAVLSAVPQASGS
jgi:nucleoside phosphorylase